MTELQAVRTTLALAHAPAEAPAPALERTKLEPAGTLRSALDQRWWTPKEEVRRRRLQAAPTPWPTVPKSWCSNWDGDSRDPCQEHSSADSPRVNASASAGSGSADGTRRSPQESWNAWNK